MPRSLGRSVGSIIRRADIDTDLDPVRDHPRFKPAYADAIERIGTQLNEAHPWVRLQPIADIRSLAQDQGQPSTAVF